MVMEEVDTSYPDLFFDNLAPYLEGTLQVAVACLFTLTPSHPTEEKTHELQKSLRYAAKLLTGLYAGVLPHLAFIGVQVLADEISILRPWPSVFRHLPIYAVRFVARLIFYPLSTISVNLQAGKYDSMLDCVRGIYKKRGIAGFWDGWIAELCSFVWEVMRIHIQLRLIRL